MATRKRGSTALTLLSAAICIVNINVGVDPAWGANSSTSCHKAAECPFAFGVFRRWNQRKQPSIPLRAIPTRGATFSDFRNCENVVCRVRRRDGVPTVAIVPGVRESSGLRGGPDPSEKPGDEPQPDRRSGGPERLAGEQRPRGLAAGGGGALSDRRAQGALPSQARARDPKAAGRPRHFHRVRLLCPPVIASFCIRFFPIFARAKTAPRPVLRA